MAHCQKSMAFERLLKWPPYAIGSQTKIFAVKPVFSAFCRHEHKLSLQHEKL